MIQSGSYISEGDRKLLKHHEIGLDDVRWQCQMLSGKSPSVILDRPCTVGDGIETVVWNEVDGLLEAHRQSVQAGRWTEFVPASGAATRMFAMSEIDDRQAFAENIDEFAFSNALRQSLRDRGLSVEKLVERGRFADLVNAVVCDEGLGYGRLPKALIPFHCYSAGARTALEEHLREGASSFAGANGPTKLHFAIAAPHHLRCSELVRTTAEELPKVDFDVTFSSQQRLSDTIAMDDSQKFVRDSHGKLLLRPGGHGALLDNLQQLDGDLIFVKNIDNISHADHRDESQRWMQILGGYTTLIHAAVVHHLTSLDKSDVELGAAFDFVNLVLPGEAISSQLSRDQLRQALRRRLRRPLRVCGMIRHEGEPGGGPFWVRDARGNVSLQIVESAEVNEDRADQRDIFARATHFNPVFMALAVRDEHQQPYDLRQFRDRERVIVRRTSIEGYDAKFLERPGLWNGAMAKWSTIFVEVPREVFSPVKTVLDLLRPEHQPRTLHPSRTTPGDDLIHHRRRTE